MPYTTNQLIADAYYASGVVSREFATVSGGQLNDGIQWLNDILADKDVDQDMLPYETTYSFFAETGVGVYFIPDLIQIDTLVFYLNKVRYPMKYSKRNEYFGSSRVENIQTLPYTWYWERKTGGGNLHIYFNPDRNYPMEVHGTFRLSDLQLGQELLVNETIANLGVYTIFPNRVFPNYSILQESFVLNPGQFVVETTVQGVLMAKDFFGEYPNIGALVNYINTGVLGNIRARISPLNEFILYSVDKFPSPIYVRTTGYPPIGTRSVTTNVFACSTTIFSVTYNNGVNGVGATMTNNVNGAIAIDGTSPTVGDLILIARSASQTYNGLYVVTDAGSGITPWILTRASNYDQSVEIKVGDLFKIVNGLTYADLTFVQTSEVTEIGTSLITFEKFNTLTFNDFSTIQLVDYKIYNAFGLDRFYTSYLVYALADRICTNYNYAVPAGVAKQLAEYEGWIEKQSRILDMQLTKVSTLQKRSTYNWAWVNLGKGWSPPS